MRTQQLAEHLGVSYRQLDYLVGRPGSPLTAEALGAAPGPGNRRIWPGWIIARLEVATKLAQIAGAGLGSQWPAIVDRVLAWDGDLPPTGWALIDDLGDAHIAETLPQILDKLRKAGGGLMVCYALSPALAEVAS